jgi:hypothetical protein
MREDQQVIEAVSSDRLCPALGEGVGTGSPNRRANDLDSFGPENLAECSCESGVTVTHQEADGALRLLQIPDQDPLHLSDPLVLRDRGDAEEVDDPALDLDDERGVGAQELRPGWSLPAGSWRKPVRASLEDREQVAEHDDLYALLGPADTMNSQEIEGAPEETKEEREGRNRRGCHRHRAWSRRRSGMCTPQAERR